MRVKKCLSMLLAVIMIGTMITSLPITASAVDIHTAAIGEGTFITVETAEELNTACDRINEKGGTYTIDLTGSFEGQVEITNKDAVVTVVGNGHTIFNDRTAVYVEHGAKVILGDNNSTLTLQGSNTFISGTTNDSPGLIHILSGSTCEMNENVTLKDRRGNNYLGGGVTVNGGNFIMNGGTIENCGIDGGSVCYGGGVAVVAGGLFKMNGGVIKNCYVTSSAIDGKDPSRCFTAMGGGVFVTAGSEFTMNGGTISNCEATNFGGGVALVMLRTNLSTNEYDLKGMGNPQSTVTINDGTITGNSADEGAGVFASGYFYAYASGVAYSIPESGSTAQPGLYIKGSTISDNEANDMGGGILIAMLRPVIKAQIYNAEIKNNTAVNGAGIENFGYWTQLDIDGCTITGNTAVANGGGIMLSTNSSGGYTNLKNTTITGNTSGDRGAGVYYDGNSQLRLSGKDIIQNNTYNGKLNNLNVLSPAKPVYVNGDLTGSQIGLSDPTLWDDGKSDTAPDAVSSELLTNGYKEHNAAEPNTFFTSDHETWLVDRTAKTVTTEDDPTSKTHREYTVKRYPIKENTYPYCYAGHTKQYEITKIQNPSVTTLSSYDDIITELRYRFENSNKYTITNSSNASVGSTYITYTPKDSNTPLSSILLKKGPNDSYVTIQYSPKRDTNIPPSLPPSPTLRPYGGSVTYQASPTIQSKFANKGELVLQIINGSDNNLSNSTYFNFSKEEEEVTHKIEYVNEDPPKIEYVNEDPPKIEYVLYEYDEHGDVAAKLVIEDPTVYVPKQAQIEIETGTDDEVRLVRKKPDYHINNTEIDDHYKNNDIFTSYVEEATKEIKVGETIDEFYTVPEVVPTDTNSCPYIFKGWYYDQENDNDTHPVKFGTDKYAKDIYAHWIKVNDVDKDAEDTNKLPAGYTKYGGFDLCGVQVRKERTIDSNFGGESMPGGLRFVTSLSKDVVNKINAIKPNNIEYGYVATNQDKEGWIKYHDHFERKLQYVSDGANGINTSESATDDKNYFGFATNVVCTSKQSNGTGGVVREDHRSHGDYLLYTLVVTYEGDNGTGYGKNVLARPYIRYKDANGLDRVAYSEYRGNSNTLGGCYTSYSKNNPDA